MLLNSFGEAAFALSIGHYAWGVNGLAGEIALIIANECRYCHARRQREDEFL